VAAAIHDGHAVRDELSPLLALDSSDRLREEDPYTGRWATVAPNRIVVSQSRFEVDLNRPREKCVYLTPADAWGLRVWKAELPSEIVARSLEFYDAFYADVHKFLTRQVAQHGRVVVYDLHTYNHRRAGAQAEPEDSEANPEVNLGTGTMDRVRWAPVVDSFRNALRSANYYGRHLDVRENVKFQGGNFPRWIHEHFPESVCVIAIEFKKFFMDEWTGELLEPEFVQLHEALQSTVPAVMEELCRL